MRATVLARCRHYSTVLYIPLFLLVFAAGCQDGDKAVPDDGSSAERTPAQASRAAAALATLRAHWDSEIITGVMVDEIKKVLDDGSPADIEPLLARLELLEQSGDVYAPDFALWWDKRGRIELGGKLFWKRDLLHQALAMAMEGRNEAEVMGMLREAAATGDPVARMWQAFADDERSGRHDGSVLGNLVALIDEVRGLIDSGDADAAYFLGMFATEGDMDLIGGSPGEVLGWLEMAAEAGNGHAAELLSKAYSSGGRGIQRDPAKAAEWAARASNAPSAPTVSVSREDEAKASSQNNLKQLGLVMKMFANESRGELFPPLTTLRGHLAMDPSAIFPEFINDVRVYISPAHPDYLNIVNDAESDAPSVISDHSYWYLGYTVPDEVTGLAFVKAFRAAAESGEVLEGDFETPELESKRIYRLRNGIERFLITDINNPRTATSLQSTIPIMIERPGFHEDGASVLFLDGHVEFISYPGKFPMTERFIRALESLEDIRERP